MKKGITLFLLSLLFITPGCKQSKETIVNEYNIVPLPNQMIPQQGRFEISKKVRVITTACTPDVQIIADSLINRLKLTSGITIKQTFENVTDEPVIRFVPQDGMPEEGYKLSVTPQNITLTASTPKGFFYAVQTLYQLLPPVVYGNQKVKNAEWSVPAVEIEDAPRFAYRGLMLDVCRHFSPVEYIYKFIDMLAMHKMNTFHWHLTDDQGWRIEIKKYPKLTEIGSKRKETLVDYYYVNYPQVFDGKEHGGYYTQEQIKAIVDYAHTPDALVNVLNAIHGVLEGKGKVITVVGAGGNRDKGKRPIMAKEAARASDRVIITSDNPRFEEPQDIINDMLAGLDTEDKKKTLSIADRKEAIRTACMLAEKGDVILVAGKGHENYQDIKGVKHHFDDKEVLKEIFSLTV
jgi:hypothetical protein